MSEDKDDIKHLTENAVNEAVKMFFSADKSLKSTNQSRGALIRALRFALHNNLTTSNISLRNDEEKFLALAIGTMLDSRLLMMAKMKKDLDDKQLNEGEDNVGQKNP